MLAIIEFLELVGYEAFLAWLMGAFRPMEEKRKKGYLLLAFIPLAVMSMFHGINVGADTPVYLEVFDLVKKSSLQEAMSNGRFERGYMLFNYLLARYFSNGQCVLSAEGAIVSISCARWINKWSKAPGLLVCLMIELLWFDHWMSLLRQSLATAILFFAFEALIEKKPIRFLLFVFLAAQFHAVAYAFLITYPAVWLFKEKRVGQDILCRKNWRYERLMLCSAIGITVLFQPILRFLLQIFPKYQYYLDGAYIDGKPRLAVILNIMVYSAMLIVPRIIQHRKLESDVCGIALYRIAWINIVLYVAANQATVMTRVTSLLSVFAMMDCAEHVAQLNCGKNRKILTVIMLILFVAYGAIATRYRTPEWQKTYPFEWCF